MTDACAAAGRDSKTLRLSVPTLLAPTESAEQEAQVRREFASIPESGLIVGSSPPRITSTPPVKKSSARSTLRTRHGDKEIRAAWFRSVCACLDVWWWGARTL
jgi:hypothetical protein